MTVTGPCVAGTGIGDTTGLDVVTEAIILNYSFLHSEYQIFLGAGPRMFRPQRYGPSRTTTFLSLLVEVRGKGFNTPEPANV
jgi:hypothetical protein